MPKKWQKLLNMRKLSEKDLILADKMLKEWYNIKSLAEFFKVSAWYFYYHWFRK